MIVGKAASGLDAGGLLSVAPYRWNGARLILQRLPRPLRFVMVGGIGLAVDLILFTIIVMQGVHLLVAGLLALLAATVVTWRLNRAFTFNRSGRDQREEALRYAAVTMVAQSTSYAIFAVLASTALAALPQGAIVIGAAAGALVSYNGHRLFAFAPRKPCSGAPRS